MKKLFALLVGVALSATLAYAQTVGPNALSGNECWNAGQGPGGPSSGFLCVNVVRGSTPNSVGTATTNPTAFPTVLGSGGDFLLTAQPSTNPTNFTLPPNPIQDGAIVRVCNTTGAAFATNVLNFVANTGQTLSTSNAFTALAAGACAAAQWNQAAATWYRVQ
jgi:hypothetical protein